MHARRILSVWFPYLGAERLLRRLDKLTDIPFAVVAEDGQAQILSSLSKDAMAAGLHQGQALRDAQAICPELVTWLQDPQAEADFMCALVRWAGRFSPWVAAQAPGGLVLDITGCAHLFGGEPGLMTRLVHDAEEMGLSAICGLADTPGAAWALARFAGAATTTDRSGDAIDQEARATRSRAARNRHRKRSDTEPALFHGSGGARRIAPPGQTHGALAGLPVAALRLEKEVVAQLSRLGLRRIGDLIGQPRAPLARRFGRDLVLRLDQALGQVPEPISPEQPQPRYVTRLSLPEPVGLSDDILAALDRLLPRLCKLLSDKGQGARAVRLQALRTDDTVQAVEVGLARAADRPEHIRPLLAMKIAGMDAGFGIDTLRLEATRVEPVHERAPTGHVMAGKAVQDRLARKAGTEELMGRIGARIGLEAITRRHPANSHIPEKSAMILAAAWSDPAPGHWPAPPAPRPLMMWRPEPVNAPDTPAPPARFRWRGRMHEARAATGPERIAPEWWLDDVNWRSGVRDYWQVVTDNGTRLWLFYAHGGTMSPGWFCQGRFA
ncbi:DNA polymerase Y family protein [Roseovarius sp. TE539]|uniref:Y-family DNA polymerase n=1 Tax=Roseovarius sp. TE539 TaxID=2249812 RepID=UPI000DDEBCD8|nr:DNA polymerase Y family protein [Roseovarius sp. TE539]RBI75998.1 DNA polymerase Y family protein [Roseovarius sp. TE539]